MVRGLINEVSSLGFCVIELSHFSKQLQRIAPGLFLGSGLRKLIYGSFQLITGISASECKVVGFDFSVNFI